MKRSVLLSVLPAFVGLLSACGSEDGSASPASTGTFVRMSYPMNAEFLTGSAGSELIGAADMAMGEHGVRRPERMVRVLAPGFPEG